MNTIISCKDLSKSYGTGSNVTKVLKKINLCIEEKTINVIYGKSGSGKTTLIHLLAGLDHPTSGDISFRDQSYTELSESQIASLRGKNYGFVFQAYHLINKVNVENNILCPGYINHEKIDHLYFNYLLEQLEIKHLVHKNPCELSGGEQQRVGIARAMILKPKIVFADEPTGNLDSENEKNISILFSNLNQEYGTTFVIVTHEEGLIECPNQTIRLKDGELVNDRKN